MSRENVEAFKRAVKAMNGGDIDGMLEVIDPDVAWRDAINAIFGGEATMYRGHDAVREVFRDLYGSFAEIDADYYDVRDLDYERVLGLGHLRMRGRESGAETESAVAAFTEWSNGKAVRVLTYLDHAEAIEAAGLED
jgi:ketosteroid isomerase-like protein